MARRARHIRVATRERIVCVCQVIEFRVCPIGGRVADRAVARETKLYVRRVIAVDVVGSMARVALSRGALEHVVDVACSAGQRGVRTR